MMDFFESLEERTVDVMHSEAWATRYRKEVREYGADKSDVLVHLTIEATIEALKEMMVGTPLKGNIELEITQDSTKMEADETTGILTQFTVKGGAEVWFNEHYGIDGEEVVVMVFKGGKEKD